MNDDYMNCTNLYIIDYVLK